MQKFAKAFISNRASIPIVDFLADELPLSKGKIKDAMQKGAVWLQRKDEKPVRVRRAKDMVKLHDDIQIYYDEDFLAIKNPVLHCLQDNEHYSVWNKPLGFLEEESLYGDHLSLARAIERDVPDEKDCFYIDPVESHITGLMLIAHSSKAGESFALQAETNCLQKDYTLSIGGKFPSGKSELVLSNKTLQVELLHYHAHTDSSEICVSEAQGFESQFVEKLVAMGYRPPELDEIICTRMRFFDPVSNQPVTVTY